MIEATCHCGAVRLRIDSAPTEVTECNCSICRRYGVLWAYYRPEQVRLVPPDGDLDGAPDRAPDRAAEIGATDTYMWDDRSVAFHRCRHCGCVSHWSAVDPARGRMGVNARLMPPEAVARARVRHLDGAGTEEYVD